MDDLTEEEILDDINDGKGSMLYRTIIPLTIPKENPFSAETIAFLEQHGIEKDNLKTNSKI
jgi:hypothetical protein